MSLLTRARDDLYSRINEQLFELIKTKTISDPKSTTMSGNSEIIIQDPEWLQDIDDFKNLVSGLKMIGLNERKYVESRNDYYHQLRVRKDRWPYNNLDAVEDIKVDTGIFVVNFHVTDLTFGVYEFSKEAMCRCQYFFRARSAEQRIIVLNESYRDVNITDKINEFLYAVQKRKITQALQLWLQSGIGLKRDEWDILWTNRNGTVIPLSNGVLPNVNYHDHNETTIRFQPKRGAQKVVARFVLNVVPNTSCTLYIAEPNKMNLQYDNDRRHRVSYETQIHQLDGDDVNLSMGMPDRLNQIMVRNLNEYVPLTSMNNAETTQKAKIVTLPVCEGIVLGGIPVPEEYPNEIEESFSDLGVFTCYSFESTLTLETLDKAIMQFQRRIIDPLPLLNQYLSTDPGLFAKLGNVRYPDELQSTFYRKLSEEWSDLMKKWKTTREKYKKTRVQEILTYFVEYELWEALKLHLDDKYREIYMYLIKNYFLFYKKVFVAEDVTRDKIVDGKIGSGGNSTGTFVYEWRRTKRSATLIEEPRMRLPISNTLDRCDYQYVYVLNPSVMKIREIDGWKCDKTKKSSMRYKLKHSDWENVNSINLSIVWKDGGKGSVFQSMPYRDEIVFSDSDFKYLNVDGVKTKVTMPCMFFVMERSRIDPFQDKYLILNIWMQILAYVPK